MELRSGYLTPVKSQGQREALSTPEDSTSGREFGNRLKHERKEREQQEAGIEISPPSMHQNPAFTSFPAFPSAPAWNPMQLNGFSQIPSLMPHLPQDTMVKVEGADGIGHLDPHYLEQYRGAATSAPVTNGSNLISASSYDMVYGTSQLPPLMHPLDLPWNADFAAINDFSLGAPMALPNLNMAMDPISVPIALPMEPATNTVTGADNDPNSIPLLCHICPKKPTFSDVSHLLTHISSKSHLAARFKLQLSDVASHKQALHRFDEWAEHYGINRLLKNRQDAKEQKKQSHLKRQRGGNEKKSRRSNGPRSEVKLESSDSLHLQLESNPLNQGSWHLHTPHASFTDPYQTPPIKRAESVYPLPDSPQDSIFVNDRADTRLIPDTLDVTDGISSATKLKGVVLPGMDLFDAATPDQRRMRNQKKHESVLKNMTRDSELIEQTEYVWDDQLLSVTRTRNVYDSPSVDGSPDSKDEEILVVKKRRARRVASTSNGPPRQTRASTRGSKAAKRRPTRAGKKPIKVEEEVDSENEDHGSQSSHAVGGFEHNIEDNLMGSDVFADQRLGMPGVTDSTMGGQPFNLAYRNAMQGLPSNRPMSSMFVKPDNQPPFGFFDKENDRAPFNLQQPGTMPGTMSSYFTQPRHNLQSNGFNPLCVQRQDSPGYPYMFGGQPFDPPKPAHSPFQPMNVMEYNPMPPGSQFQNGNTQNQNGAFDI